MTTNLIKSVTPISPVTLTSLVILKSVTGNAAIVTSSLLLYGLVSFSVLFTVTTFGMTVPFLITNATIVKFALAPAAKLPMRHMPSVLE